MEQEPTAAERADAPIGRTLWDAVSLISRQFDEALAAAGGTRSLWFILLALVRRPRSTQREIASAVGIREATVTHHLAGMEEDGLVVRRRCEHNRRAHTIELTPEGQAAFRRLQEAANRFDRRLRAGVSEEELRVVREVLDRLVANATQD